MAINPGTRYPGKIAAPGASYPYGSAQNVTVPGDGTGTPWEQAIVNDMFGIFQKLLNAAGVVPSGNPDTIVSSDYFDSLEKLFSRYTVFNDTGVANAIQLAAGTGTAADVAAYSDTLRVGFFLNATITGATTVQIAALGNKALKTRAGAALVTGRYKAGDWVEAVYDSVAGWFEITNSPAVGSVVQSVNVQDGAVATGTTILPIDDTIPQQTEGDEYMTLAIVPTKATNILKVEVVMQLAHTSSGVTVTPGALFQDAAAGAIAAGLGPRDTAANSGTTVAFTHYMVAGTVASTTFKARGGAGGAGTTTFNGVSAGRLFGGVMASSITITEIEA